MNDLTKTIDIHLQAYTEADEAKRASLVAEVWACDGALVDPPFAGAGHDEIAGMGATLLSQFPGHTFRRTSAIDAHHQFARYGWDLVAPDGNVVLNGMDVIEVDDGGKLKGIVGFFGGLS